ncbi:MAG: LD-carboxypeptidase [Lentimicrobiaceae bacterium]|nr:LD-carboxypeptidase [Lentimicrobiaceae bacterium]
MIRPSSLSKGSKVAIAAPARAIKKEEIEYAVQWLSEKGFEAVFDERLFRCHHQFAGTDEERALLLQEYLDSNDIDAILCARGGYGTIRIIDRLNFEKFRQHPKWVIGYSDVTVLHAKLQSLGYESLHASMPINFSDNSAESLESLYRVLIGENIDYIVDCQRFNEKKIIEAELVGGNISVLYSMLGSDIFPDTEGRVLFLEDLDEYLYHIDRMLIAMDRAAKISGVKAFLIGGLTQMHDNTINFGQSAEDIISERAASYGIPVIFGIPAGHIKDNRTLILGRKIRLVIDESVKIEFL